MSDEQTIYIGPEDDLTSVRERLERIQSRRVTLVIPAQTQLRSHVAWKLLHARARELSKDVLIVSSDPQIRSVAQAVKFKVAHSLESSPISRSRPGSSRTGRSVPGNRGGRTSGAQPRTPSGRGPRGARPGNTSLRSPEQPHQWIPPERTESREAKSAPSRRDEAITGGLDEPFSSATFDLPEQRSAAPYEYPHSETTPPAPPTPPVTPMPPIHPLSPGQIEEEPDLLLEDFNLTQDIRRAARGDAADEAGPVAEPRKPSSQFVEPPVSRKPSSQFVEPPAPRRSDVSSTPPQPLRASDDPFVAMEDDSRPPVRAEQRGGVSLEGTDTNEAKAIQDIADVPTGILDHDIEDMGDQGAFEMYDNDQPITRHDWEDEIHTAGPVRESGPSTRSSRASGSLKKAPASPRPDFESEDALPPAEDRPARAVPATPPVPPVSPSPSRGAPASPVRPAASLGSRAGGTAPPRGRPGLSRPPQRPGRERAARQPSRAGRAAAAQQRSLAGYASVVVIVLILLVVGALAYFGPSAQVTVTLVSRSYSHAISLKAVPKGQQAADGTVMADVLTRDFTKGGMGNATGTAKINNQSASGSVTFTNNGKVQVAIPTGTIVATTGANGQQFATTANAVVLPPGSNNAVGNSMDIPIQAVKAGPDGNVKSGTITVIPDDSLSQIAKYNNGMATTDLNLQVSNKAATTGGGAGNATVVSRKDLDTTTKNLQAALNGDITAWVKQQHVAAQDIVGNPAITAALVKPPAEGTVENSGTFPAQLSATVTLMIVRGSTLQGATIQQVNNLLAKDKAFAGYVVAQDTAQPVQIQTLKQSGQGTSLTLNYTAIAQTIPNLTADQVRSLVGGKRIPDATQNLKSIKNVQNVSIKITPGFIPWITSWGHNINVVLEPGAPASSSPPPTPKK
jgi:hypothetical protein